MMDAVTKKIEISNTNTEIAKRYFITCWNEILCLDDIECIELSAFTTKDGKHKYNVYCGTKLYITVNASDYEEIKKYLNIVNNG